MSFILNRITSVIPIGGVANLAGNTGGNVGPTAGVINIVGSGTIAVTGNPGTSTLTISGTATSNLTITSVNFAASPYTVLTTDQFLAVNSTGGAITIRLPNAPATGRVIYIKDVLGTANTNSITLTTVGGSVTIDGATTFVMNTQYESVSVVFTGSSYSIF